MLTVSNGRGGAKTAIAVTCVSVLSAIMLIFAAGFRVVVIDAPVTNSPLHAQRLNTRQLVTALQSRNSEPEVQPPSAAIVYCPSSARDGQHKAWSPCEHQSPEQSTVAHFTPCVAQDPPISPGRDRITKASSALRDAFGWFLARTRLPIVADRTDSARRSPSGRDTPEFAFKERRRGARTPVTVAYHLSHVCISADGSGLYANLTSSQYVDQGTMSGAKIVALDGLQDERRAPVLGELYIRDEADARAAGRNQVWFSGSRPLVVHPVLSQSDNLGHVMYRAMNLRRLLRELVKGDASYTNATVLFLATGAAKNAATVHHRYDVFADAMLGPHTPWISAATPGTLSLGKDVPVDAPRAIAPDAPDLCFDKALLGWDAVHMYSGRYAHQRVNQARVTIPELRDLRASLSTCYVPPSPRGRVDRTSVRWVTLIQRPTRRILGLGLLANALSAALQSGRDGTSTWKVRIAKFDEMTPAQQAQVAESSQVLIGMHGTALQWSLLLPQRGVLVEIQYDGYSCAPPGINQRGHEQCEFGPAAMAASASHIVYRINDPELISCDAEDAHKRLCDAALLQRDSERIVGLVLCAYGLERSEAARRCDNLPSTSLRLNSTAEAETEAVLDPQ
jgi:hypothetical protein